MTPAAAAAAAAAMTSLHNPGLLPRDGQADQFLQLIKSPFNTKVSTAAFWSSLGYSIGFAVVCAVLFCVLRPYNRTVYAPRLKHADEKRAPPPIDNGVFGWVQPVVKTTDQVLVEKIGEDGAVFLRFIKMCRNIMLILSVIGCAVYIPINVKGNRKWAVENPDIEESTAFGDLTPMHVTGSYCWAYVAVTYVFNIVVCFFLWTNYRAVTDLRRQYFESPDYQGSLHARTLLVTDVPKDYRSDEGVARIVDEVSTDGDPTGAIAHNVKGLPELIEEHEEAVRELEAVLAKYLKNPDKLPPKRPRCKAHKEDRDHTSGSKVDAIDYLTSRIEKLAAKIHEARKAVGNRKVLPYGFASFPNIEQAHDLAYAARRKHPHGTTVQLAPKPSDLIWKNLPLDPKTRSWRSFMNNVWVTALTLVWTVPNALIAIFLANLSNLGSVWPDFQKEMARDPKVWGAIQGILAPLVTTLFYMLLPTIFRRLSAYAGDYSKTERERHVTHRLYAFFLFNNLIVFSLFSAGWTYATAVIEAQRTMDLWTALRKTEPFQNLVGAFCGVSPFWLNYLLQRNLGAAIDISQLAKLSRGWLMRKLFNSTPRENIELTAPPPFDYASYYNNFLFYMTVALVFAPFQPLVLPVAAFYFSLDNYLKKYLLMYVFVTKHESGGAFWKLLANRMLVASFLGNVFAFLFVAARREKHDYVQLIVMAPVILILLGFKIYCMKTFDDDQHYYSKGLKDVKEEGLPSRRKGEKVGVRFGHPALYQKLMVPMVHARAQHILKDIYRGRLDTGLDDVSGYGESYNMQNMSKKQSGQAGGAAAPFELVHESQMDFAHYRDRADFRGEMGDGAHLYGQSAETSRPSTPSTLQASRAASPAPSAGHRSPYDTEATVTPDGGEGVTYPNGYFAPPGTMGTPGRSPLARQDSDENYNGAVTPQPPPLDRTNSHSRLL